MHRKFLDQINVAKGISGLESMILLNLNKTYYYWRDVSIYTEGAEKCIHTLTGDICLLKSRIKNPYVELQLKLS